MACNVFPMYDALEHNTRTIIIAPLRSHSSLHCISGLIECEILENTLIMTYDHDLEGSSRPFQPLLEKASRIPTKHAVKGL